MGEQRTRDDEQQESPLKTERGNTTVQDSVVSKVAGIAAQEVEGIRMGGGASQTVGSIMSAVPGVGGGSQSQGVSVEVGEVEAAVDLTVTVEYGRTIHQLAEAVRSNVIRRVENLVGLRVTEVNIAVSDIFFPQQEQQEQ
ncbi:MAG: Asp23/Gls24 family envelope stress response protein [Rubrobacter sp.]|nr:Asp23/Gls24 family envelope stress response protein [Rubrobacter sp.]